MVTRRVPLLSGRGRIRALLLFVLAGYLVLFGRLVYWQAIKHESLAKLAAAEHDDVVTLAATRGPITDSKGALLAVNTPAYSVFASPDQIEPADRVAVAGSLSPLLGLSHDRLLALLSSKRKFVYLKRGVSVEVAREVDRLQLPGIGKLQESRRTYIEGAVPGTTLAANLLGFVNLEGHGNYGVEGYYDRLLAGSPGFVATVRDVTNRPIVLSDRQREEPVDGYSVQLSLDSAIQILAERALADALKQYKAASASLLIMEPMTGRIVAWANVPSYDANQYDQVALDRPASFADPNIAHLYEPGSVMKVLTLAGALDTHAITPDYRFNETGSVTVGGYRIHNWDNRAHGLVSMTEVLRNSLNVGAIKAEELEGPDRFFQYLQGFGIGELTAVDLAGETRAPLGDYRRWKASELATASFGQGISVTPIEMLAAINVIATGGELVWPHAVDRVIDSSGQAQAVIPRVLRRVISPEAAKQMQQMMVEVVERGSGFAARMDGFRARIAGKTGTAEIPENGQYGDDVIASFVGFMPVEQPRFTMMVIVRKPKIMPKSQREGAYIAAPIWKTVASALLTAWNITP